MNWSNFFPLNVLCPFCLAPSFPTLKWFSKRGPQMNGISITSDSVINAKCWTSPHNYGVRNFRAGSSELCSKFSLWFWCTQQSVFWGYSLSSECHLPHVTLHWQFPPDVGIPLIYWSPKLFECQDSLKHFKSLPEGPELHILWLLRSSAKCTLHRQQQ